MKRTRFSVISIKIWMGLLIVLLTMAVLFVLTLSNMAPQLNVVPQLFLKDPMNFNQLAEVTNLKARIKEQKLIDEMLVRFYIENRVNYIPDMIELSYRYGDEGPVYRLSAPDVYSQFLKTVGNYTESDEENTATTVADILQVDRMDNTFTVDFDVYNYDKGIMSFGGRRRATVRISHAPAYRGFGADFVNPYGFVVVSYGETGLKKQ